MKTGKPRKLKLYAASSLVIISMALTACGGETATPTSPPPAPTNTTAAMVEPTTTTAMMAEPTATAAMMEAATATTGSGGTTGGEGGTIKLVSSLPRTGLSKTQTDDVVDGIKLALEEHGNKAGDFSIVYEDWDDATAQAGKWDAATEQANATKAANDPDIMVYIGTFNSGAAKIAIPILNKVGLAMISPANTAPELTKKGFDDATLATLYPNSTRNYFRVVIADDVQGQAAANWAKELGYKKVYILNDQEVYGKGVANVFEKKFKANGGEVIANEGIDSKQPEFKSVMNKIKGTGADLVYFGGLVDSGGPQLLKDLRSVAPEIGWMGPDGTLTQAFIDAAGADVAAGAYGTVAGTNRKDLQGKGAAFYKNFAAKFGKDNPDPYAIYGYEAMNVTLEAIARAGKKDRAAIMEQIRATKDYDGALGKWSFDENGDTTLDRSQDTMGGYKVIDSKWEFQKYLAP